MVLDHIYSIEEIEIASNGNLLINFNDANAFEYSRKQWGGLSQFVFVTYTPGCGDFHKKDRCYFLANSLSFDETTFTITAHGDAADIGEVTHDVHLSFGSYRDQVASSLHARQESNTTNLPVWTGPDTRHEEIGHVSPDCTAPVDTKYGLRTACQGSYFDDDLDIQLGFDNFNAFSWGSFASDTLLESVGNEVRTLMYELQARHTLTSYLPFCRRLSL